MKESELFGWFFKSTRLSSSVTQPHGSARFDKSKMAPFWEYDPADSKYLDVLYEAWMKFNNFEEAGNCYVENGARAIRAGCFELALISVHLVEEAKAVTTDFLNMQTLNMYQTDFKPLRAMRSQRLLRNVLFSFPPFTFTMISQTTSYSWQHIGQILWAQDHSV